MPIELSCPFCGSIVDPDEITLRARCPACGRACVFEELRPKRMEVILNDPNAITADKLISAALGLWLTDDDDRAMELVNQAIPMAPGDVRVWILKSLIENVDVSEAIGDARMDPTRDLDFCIKVINKDPSAIDLMVGRMDHPLIYAIADFEDAAEYLDESDDLVVTIFTDELETGYARAANEVKDLAERLPRDEEELEKYPQMNDYLEWVRYEQLSDNMAYLSHSLSEPATESQEATIIYTGKVMIGKVIHTGPDVNTITRVKKTIYKETITPGRHEFVDGSYTGRAVVFLPRMPARKLTVTVGPDTGLQIVHTFSLEEDVHINVNTRDDKLPLS